MAKIALIAGHASSLVNFRGPLIKEMVADGHEVIALAPETDQDTSAWLTKHHVTFYQIPLSRAGLSPCSDFNTFKEIRGILEKTRPDAVVSYTIKAVIYGMLAAKSVAISNRCAMITGLGYAFTEGDKTFKRRIVGGFARLLYGLALRHAHIVIFQNQDDLDLFRQLKLIHPKSRIGVVNGSGVDTQYFLPSPLPEQAVCLMISRLVADKGVVEYLNAARLVKSIRSDVRFILVGPRDPNPSALPVGLLESVIAEGVVDYRGEMPDVRPAISECSIYVLPSYREGTPRSVLEAMSMARPVVTTDAPGCRETVTDQVNGLLVPIKSPSKLAAAILRLAKDVQLRETFAQAGRKIAIERYDATIVARSVLDLLKISPVPPESPVE